MKVCFAVRPTLKHQREYAEIMATGFARHGVETTIQERGPYDCDLMVFWGMRHPIEIEHCQRAGIDYLVMERAYLGDRFHWVSLGYNGLNGRADFGNHDVPPDRGDLWREQMQPWQTDGSHVLVIGQVPGDAACKTHGYDEWERTAAEKAKAYGLPVKWRPHPHFGRLDATLEQDLEHAAACVTFNSNSGVVAAMAGVPVVTHDPGAMAWDVSGHTIGEIRTPDRDEWLNRLAYCQWTPEEIAAGDAWEHLRKRYAD